ncbi:Shugoshin C terminus, putative isoform 1 [Hibiscus syriacus]|uniref:poly(A)-specific ribonuclease n=1 Tax=Hibiscus syriacus TaxID=106335 RepID=A0A6A2XYM4_HIBSY|nr:Shugoshin C terminus, putative isoform 1 [Hibiscus syriacus]
MEMLRKKPVIVRRVFADRLEYEFELIRSTILMYRFVSMDTEFPGTIFKPSKQIIQEGDPSINYEYLRSNVDALQVIQLGLTLSDSEGNLPDFGINFVKNREKGIDSSDFAILMRNSGLLNNGFGGLTWLTFHGVYDFGFLMKILTQCPLPDHIQCFMNELVYIFGWKIFDIKHTFKFFGMFGGLEKVAEMLNVAYLAGFEPSSWVRAIKLDPTVCSRFTASWS